MPTMPKRRLVPLDLRGCPRCGRSVRAVHTFCPHCGWPLAIDGQRLVIYFDLPNGALDAWDKDDGDTTT